MSAPINEAGCKHDSGKLPMSLLSPNFLAGTAWVLKFGAEKYGVRNWEKGIAYSRVFDALQRHLWAFWNGEELDDESDLPHLWHAACCLMFLIHYEGDQRYRELDDRPLRPAPEVVR